MDAETPVKHKFLESSDMTFQEDLRRDQSG